MIRQNKTDHLRADVLPLRIRKSENSGKICRAARNRGIPITAIVLLLQPFGTLFVPKWVAMVSGMRFQSRSPITIGKEK